MTLGIIGGSGFIGNDFLQRYGANFSAIRVLHRRPVEKLSANMVEIIGSLDNKEAIEGLTEGCDVLVHAGFDHSYKDNLIGIKNILKACDKNSVKTLIYLSSYIVYDLNKERPPITENSEKSKLQDIYTHEKQKIESLLAKAPSSLLKIVLQPSIVYGLEGNWSKTIIGLLRLPELTIPKNGKENVAAVYVADVSQAIFRATQQERTKFKNGYQCFLISNKSTVQWHDLYKLHAAVMSEESKELDYSLSNENVFAEGNLKNLIIRILYSKLAGFFMRPLLKILKGILESKKTASDKLQKNSVSLNGLSRALHFGSPSVKIYKAEQELGYKPEYHLEKSFKEMCINYDK